MKSIKILFLMLMIQGLFVQAGEESTIDDSVLLVEIYNPLHEKRKFQEASNTSRSEFIQLQVRNYAKLDEGLALLRRHDKTIPTLADFIEQNLVYDDQDANFDESINENRFDFGEVIQQVEDIILVTMKIPFVEIIEKLIESHKNIRVMHMLHSQYVVNPVENNLRSFMINYCVSDVMQNLDKRLLSRIENFNNRPLDEQISMESPIFRYVMASRDKFMKPILQNWVNSKDSNNTTLLQKTLQHNNPTLAHILIALGVDITTKNEHSQTLLHQAASLNLVEIISILISYNELSKKEQSKYPIKKIKIIDENDRDDQGQTALHKAVESDAQDVIIMLLGRRVHQFIVDNKRFNALSLAIYSKKIAITEMLLTTSWSQSLLASKDDFCLCHAWNGMVNRYQNNPESLSFKNFHDRNDVELMQMLLDKGCRLEQVNFILYEAIRFDLTDIGLMLLKHNVDVHFVQANHHNSMLCHAVENNNEAVVERLIAKGANIHDRDLGTGQPFLSLAVQNKNQNIVKMLLDAGVNINEIDDQGQTALHQAAQLNSIDIARMLVERGVVLTIVDNQGHRAEELAQTDEMKELFVFICIVN